MSSKVTIPHPHISSPRARFEQRVIDFKAYQTKHWRGEVIMQGMTPTPSDVMIGHNDYLKLAQHPDIRAAQVHSLTQDEQALLMSSVFFTGPSRLDEFEREMARFMRAQSTVLAQSGYMANIGLLQAIADATVPVYIDMLAHMSLWEGAHMAKSTPHAFPHNQTGRLEKLIQRHGPGVILVDSVYSTDGSIAPLAELCEISTRNNCLLVVDESHSLGTHGPKGAGLVVELGLEEHVDFRTASLAKAFAGRAGILTCASEDHIYMLSQSSPTIFSSTLLPHEIAGLQATLQLIQSADDRRNRLHQNAKLVRQGLREIGFGISSDSQIVGLESGIERLTVDVRTYLEQRGVFGAAFAPPATPHNRAEIRFSLHSELTENEIDHLLSVCEELYSAFNAAEWASTRRNRRNGMVGRRKHQIENRAPGTRLQADRPADSRHAATAVS